MPVVAVIIDYTNWEGVRRERRVIPFRIEFGHTEFHPQDQWLLSAYDTEKHEVRTFAMKDIHSWRPA